MQFASFYYNGNRWTWLFSITHSLRVYMESLWLPSAWYFISGFYGDFYDHSLCSELEFVSFFKGESWYQ